MACQRSQSDCNPSQKSAGIPKTRANRSAVSGVIARLPRMTSFKRGYDTPSRCANSVCVMPRGLINSSSSISPGSVGGRSRGSRRVTNSPEPAGCPIPWRFLMIIRDFDRVGTSRFPSKAYSILLVDPDAVLPRTVTSQSFKAISRGNGKFRKLPYPIHLIEFPPGYLPQPAGAGLPSSSTLDTIKDILGPMTPKRAYHGSYYNSIRYSFHTD
jgi:hypothetical protein